MRECTGCHVMKPFSDFHKSKNGKHGRASRCIVCMKAYYAAHNQKQHVKEAARIRMANRRDDYPEKELLAKARFRASEYGLPFDLSPEDIVIPETCPVLGVPLERGLRTSSDYSPSLDRIEPKKGYVRGNVAVISLRANRLKSDATLEELKAIFEYASMFRNRNI